jgi:hypothetical protein
MNSNYGIWDELPNELFILGDIHGDFYALKQSLTLTECVVFDKSKQEEIIKTKGNEIFLIDGCDYYYVNKNIFWNPNKINCFIVFAGDLVDRCRLVNNNICLSAVNDENCDYKILKLLLDLDIEARKYNSRVIIVLGNHEIMNIQNTLKYVSIKGINDINRKNNIEKIIKDNSYRLYGIIRIKNYLICHGGINPDFIEKNIHLFNKNIEFTQHYNSYVKNFLLKNENSYLITDTQSPFWDRTNGLNVLELSNNQCDKIFKQNLLNISLDNLNNLKLVVAHCPQSLNTPKNGINITNCGNYKNRIWRIDISMSRAFDNYITDTIILDILLKELENFINTGLNIPNFLKFYVFREYSSVQLLKISKKNMNEEIIFGQLSLYYFYNDIFEQNYYLLFLYLLQDMFYYYSKLIQEKVININNFKNIIDYISKLTKMLTNKIFNNSVEKYDIIY